MNKKPFIKLLDCSIEIPIFHADHFSLRASVTKRIKKTVFISCIENMNLEIKSGDKVGLYGPNGSGKTTLLRCIAGGYIPTSGKIEKYGTINNLIDTGIAIDFESSGYENIEIKLLFLNHPIDKIQETRDEIIEFSGLGDAIYNPVKTYSTGMLMRLTFSIVTSVKSEILLLDEWLSVGDEEFAKKADKKMQDIASDANIIVMASHNIEMLKNICNKIIHLESGKVSKIEDI